MVLRECSLAAVGRCHGDVVTLGELPQFRERARPRHASARQDCRTLGARDGPGCARQRLGVRDAARTNASRSNLEVGLGAEVVGRHGEHGGTRVLRPQVIEGVGDQVRHVVHGRGDCLPAGDRGQHAHLVFRLVREAVAFAQPLALDLRSDMEQRDR